MERGASKGPLAYLPLGHLGHAPLSRENFYFWHVKFWKVGLCPPPLSDFLDTPLRRWNHERRQGSTFGILSCVPLTISRAVEGERRVLHICTLKNDPSLIVFEVLHLPQVHCSPSRQTFLGLFRRVIGCSHCTHTIFVARNPSARKKLMHDWPSEILDAKEKIEVASGAAMLLWG